MFLPRLFLILLLAGRLIPAGAQIAHSTTHRLEIHEKAGTGVCSSTAIGEHRLLTATHCVEDGLSFKVDGKPVVTTEIENDGADHSIVTLSDATEFTDVAPVNLSGLNQGDHVFMWGNPDGFPDQYREGYVTGRIVDKDDSFVITLDLNGYFGDSGAGLFNDKGEIVGVVSVINNSTEGDGAPNFKLMGAFPIKFTAAQINGQPQH